MGNTLELCIHHRVCRHFQEDEDGECCINEVCKHFSLSYQEINKMPEVKRKDPKAVSGQELQQIFKQARIYIGLHMGELDENQKAAVEAQKGKFYSTLTDAQIQQIIMISGSLKAAKNAKE